MVMYVPRAVMWSKLYGSERIMISKQMMEKLYTSPRWVPRGGGKFSRRISGDVHSLPIQERRPRTSQRVASPKPNHNAYSSDR